MAKILIIDDDPQMRRMMNRVLTAAGHEVIEAEDGRIGLAQFIAHRSALVVTDIVMPGKEGVETIRDLRRQAPGVPVLAISGSGYESYLEMARMFGATAALTKPFHGAALIAAVNGLLAPAAPPPHRADR
jgi:DNA-binding response OmpR family regulator